MKMREKWRNIGNDRGSAVLYIFASVALMALLLFAVTKSSTERSPKALEVARIEAQYRQAVDTIRAEVLECILTYPNKVDLDGNGVDDNNNPYPPLPLPHLAFDPFNEMYCPGAPSGQQSMFTGKNGRFAPTIPAGASVLWTNGTIDVTKATFTFILGSADAVTQEAWRRIANGCDLVYSTTGGCGNGCLYIYFYSTTPLC